VGQAVPAASADPAESVAQVVRAGSEVPEGLAVQAGPAASAGQGALVAPADPEGQVESVVQADPAAREALAVQAGPAAGRLPIVRLRVRRGVLAVAPAPRRGPLAVPPRGQTSAGPEARRWAV
jgi:hypothetical protein